MTEIPVTGGAGWSGSHGVDTFLGRRLGVESAAAEPGLHAQVDQRNRRNPEIRKVFGKERSV